MKFTPSLCRLFAIRPCFQGSSGAELKALQSSAADYRLKKILVLW